MPVRISAAHLKSSFTGAFLIVLIRETTLLCKHSFANKDRLDGMGFIRYWGSVYAKFFFITTSSSYTISISISVHSKNYTCSSLTERTHDVVITLLLRQNYVAISFWRNDNVIVCPLNYVLLFCGSEIQLTTTHTHLFLWLYILIIVVSHFQKHS